MTLNLLNFCIVFSIIMTLLSCSHQTESLEQNEKIIELKKKAKDLEINLLKEKEVNSLLRENYWFDKEYDGIEFLEKGLPDPEAFVDSSLRANPSLIPIEGILGGTMNFGKIQLISKSWVLADYNDGHIQGRSIYEFDLKENGALDFKIIRSISY